MNQLELSETEENIIFLAKILSNYPFVSMEFLQDAYVDAGLEINDMTIEQKTSFLAEITQNLKRFREPNSTNDL